MLATVALTASLFIIIPKGFFPEQDTGLILGVTQAAQDVSPDGMATLQQRMIAAVKQDAAVASVGAYIGAGGATSTENQGLIFIALKPRDQRAPISQVMARLDQETNGVTGRSLLWRSTGTPRRAWALRRNRSMPCCTMRLGNDQLHSFTPVLTSISLSWR
jgi:multidrug efflux pump subunit AcrB